MKTIKHLQKPLSTRRPTSARSPAHAIPGAQTSVQSVTILAIRKVARLLDNTWDAMATTVSQGQFLIRRRPHQRPDQCPFLCFESTLSGGR